MAQHQRFCLFPSSCKFTLKNLQFPVIWAAACNACCSSSTRRAAAPTPTVAAQARAKQAVKLCSPVRVRPFVRPQRASLRCAHRGPPPAAAVGAILGRPPPIPPARVPLPAPTCVRVRPPPTRRCCLPPARPSTSRSGRGRCRLSVRARRRRVRRRRLASARRVASYRVFCLPAPACLGSGRWKRKKGSREGETEEQRQRQFEGR